MPVDFLDHINETYQQLGERYTAGDGAIVRWVREAAARGVVRKNAPSGAAVARPVPDDFIERLQEPMMTLRADYKASAATVRRWIKECGAARTRLPGGAVAAPIPADFAEVQKGKTHAQLIEHYAASRSVVKRWFAEAGIKREPFRQPVPHRPLLPISSSPRGQIKPTRVFVDTSLAGQAADYLRRYGPVVRCDAQGSFNERGTHWRRGPSILTAAEVIERAVRNGWRDPMELAA